MDRKRQRPSSSPSPVADADYSGASTDGANWHPWDDNAERSISTEKRNSAPQHVEPPIGMNRSQYGFLANSAPCEEGERVVAPSTSLPDLAQLQRGRRPVRRCRFILERLDLPAPPEPVLLQQARATAAKVTKGCGSELTLVPVTPEVQEWAEAQLRKRAACSGLLPGLAGGVAAEALFTAFGTRCPPPTGGTGYASIDSNPEAAVHKPFCTPTEAFGVRQPATPTSYGAYATGQAGDTSDGELLVAERPSLQSVAIPTNRVPILNRDDSGIPDYDASPFAACTAWVPPARQSTADKAALAGLTAMQSLPYPAAKSLGAASCGPCGIPTSEPELRAEASRLCTPEHTLADAGGASPVSQPVSGLSVATADPDASTPVMSMAALVASVAGSYSNAPSTPIAATREAAGGSSSCSEGFASRQMAGETRFAKSRFTLYDTPVKMEPMEAVYDRRTSGYTGAFSQRNVQQPRRPQRPQMSLLQEIQHHRQRLRQQREEQQREQQQRQSQTPESSTFGNMSAATVVYEWQEQQQLTSSSAPVPPAPFLLGGGAPAATWLPDLTREVHDILGDISAELQAVQQQQQQLQLYDQQQWQQSYSLDQLQLELQQQPAPNSALAAPFASTGQVSTMDEACLLQNRPKQGSHNWRSAPIPVTAQSTLLREMGDCDLSCSWPGLGRIEPVPGPFSGFAPQAPFPAGADVWDSRRAQAPAAPVPVARVSATGAASADTLDATCSASALMFSGAISRSGWAAGRSGALGDGGSWAVGRGSAFCGATAAAATGSSADYVSLSPAVPMRQQNPQHAVGRVAAGVEGAASAQQQWQEWQLPQLDFLASG